MAAWSKKYEILQFRKKDKPLSTAAGKNPKPKFFIAKKEKDKKIPVLIPPKLEKANPQNLLKEPRGK